MGLGILVIKVYDPDLSLFSCRRSFLPVLLAGQLVISYVPVRGAGGLSQIIPFGNPVSFPPQVAKAVTQALNRCVSCLPGQRDVDNALRAVGDASKRLLSDSVGGTGMPARGKLSVPELLL